MHHDNDRHEDDIKCYKEELITATNYKIGNRSYKTKKTHLYGYFKRKTGALANKNTWTYLCKVTLLQEFKTTQ